MLTTTLRGATATPSRSIYLDHHATTPVHPEVWAEMGAFATELFYNPSGIYPGSLVVQDRLQAAADTVRRYLHAPNHHVVFTSGATEANNLSLKCFAGEPGRAMLVSPTEHKSVIATSAYLNRARKSRVLLRVDGRGQVDLEELEARLRDGAALVSVMAVNNEIGTAARVREIAALCRSHDALFHCDATQAMDTFPLDLADTPADLVTFSAHKIYGPKGAGCLVVSERALERFDEPHIHGGGQQQGLRAGTENVMGIMGMARALEVTARDLERNVAHRRALRDRLQAALASRCEVVVNGDPERRHPGNLHVSFRGVVPQRLFARCSRIAFSTGSACNSQSGETSHVLRAIGLPAADIKASMRLSVGISTTADDVDAAVEVLADAARQARP